MKEVLINYSDVLSHCYDDFRHNTVIQGTILLVEFKSKVYRAAYIMPDRLGIIVKILEEFVLV